MIRDLTLDAGALIEYERGDQRVRRLVAGAIADGRQVTVPTVVVAEAWRDPRSWSLGQLLKAAVIEPLDEELARRAGELCGRVPGATTIDAIVAVSAAQRGDIVITTDAADLQRLAGELPAIRVWSAAR